MLNTIVARIFSIFEVNEREVEMKDHDVSHMLCMQWKD